MEVDDKDFAINVEIFDPEIFTWNNIIYKYDLSVNRYMAFTVADRHAFNLVNRIWIKSSAIGTLNEYTKVGLITYRIPKQEWTVKIPSRFIVLESSTEGFLIIRTTKSEI